MSQEIMTHAAYNAVGQVTASTDENGHTTTYAYDGAGNMVSKTVDSVVTNYAYDAIDRLLSETRIGYSCSYTYDANGNRLSKTLNGVTENYTYDDADKMLTAGSKSYAYDAAGRTVSVSCGGQTTTYSYDYESRLTQIVYPNGATNAFAYNGLDARVGRTDSGGTRTFKRDGAGVTDAVLSDGVSAYTPGVSVRTSGATRFMHMDYLKTVGLETSSAQTVSASRTYDAFGLPVSSTGSSASVFGFAGGWGYQEDPDSGLKLLGHRYYDPSTGRFLTRDPAKDGRNWYAYGAGQCSPTSGIDRTGGWWERLIPKSKGGGYWKWIIVPTNKQKKEVLKEAERLNKEIHWDNGHLPDGRSGGRLPKHANAGDLHVCTKAEANAADHPDWTDWESDAKKIGKKGPWKGLLMIAVAVVSGDAYSVGEGLGEAIEGPVGDCNAGYKGWTYGWRAGIDPRELMSY